MAVTALLLSGMVPLSTGCAKPKAVSSPPSAGLAVTIAPLDESSWDGLKAKLAPGFKLGIGAKGKDTEPIGKVDVTKGEITVLAQTESGKGPLSVSLEPENGGDALVLRATGPVNPMVLPNGTYRVSVTGEGRWRMAIYR